ncbi:MAG: hypothetical protein WB818_08140, partial [Desulfobacterales bacterium]
VLRLIYSICLLKTSDICIGISHPISLGSFSLTIFSPRFTDWLAVGCEMPSLLESVKALMPSSRAAISINKPMPLYLSYRCLAKTSIE